MFVEDAQIERDALRQGDILVGVPFPLFDRLAQKLTVLAEAEPGSLGVPQISLKAAPHHNDNNWFIAQIRVRLCFCAILSQCCELELHNGQMRSQMLNVARLIPIKPSIQDNAEKLDRLKANGNPAGQDTRHYLEYFYIEPNERLGGLDSKWMVDFSQLASFPKSEYSEVLKLKTLQMDDLSRVKFKIRAGYYVGRPTDEEADGHLFDDPWAAPIA